MGTFALFSKYANIVNANELIVSFKYNNYS